MKKAGSSIVVYHGTNAERCKSYGDGAPGDFTYDGPKFFTESFGHASFYAGDQTGSCVVEAQLELKNPLVITEEMGGFAYLDGSEGGGIFDDCEWLIEKGYDGAVFNEDGKPTVWVAFHHEQIKVIAITPTETPRERMSA